MISSERGAPGYPQATVIHRNGDPAVAALGIADHTGAMTDTATQHQWTTRLDDAAATLAGSSGSLPVHTALALAWQTGKAVNHPASPATELGWMQLAEALVSTRNDLSMLDNLPVPIDLDAAPAVDGDLADTPALRAAVARLLRAAAAALRRLPAGTEGEATGLATSSIAAALDSTVEDWP
jgi:hypothetical protein